MTKNEGYEARVRENLKKILTKIEHDMQAQSWASFEGEVVERYIDMFMGSMQMDMPFSVKEVLDRGGAIRRLRVYPFADGVPVHLELQLPVSSRSWDVDLPEIDPETYAVSVTMLIEPLPASDWLMT
ncbi:hypothetical protein LCGC14_0595120 [marine sediment metagenome]|uniref:Uncharacterized protein n=1 Tax=marine sediment metagenome TaxID=412755 RepID=A0A0F9UKM9_9ZZZZ